MQCVRVSETPLRRPPVNDDGEDVGYEDTRKIGIEIKQAAAHE